MPDYPSTRVSEAVEVLHGEPIPDPYRWLEDGESGETREWTERQNALTESYLRAVPGREAIRRRLDELLAIGALSVPAPVRGRYFYQRRDGRQNQPVLYVREGPRQGFLDIFTEFACQNGHEVKCDDNEGGCPTTFDDDSASSVKIDAKAGRSYFIVVDGNQGQSGRFQLRVDPLGPGEH